MAGLAASDKISDLTSERTNWCICVNVVKTWESFESDGLVNVNFLLTNAEVIFNFTVLIDQSERRLTKIKARIVLIDGTGISPGVDPEEYQPMDLVRDKEIMCRVKRELADMFYDRGLHGRHLDSVCALHNWRIDIHHVAGINVENAGKISSFDFNP
ncbi:unnamed protein product [Microthlaspi erraticum]|uniref:DUF223 domain-containing protein n=1 Tax=Microthlaspi erraticum TaxID=1685480 RepID=A0A6D2I4X2_9BRAS|nr:unnamed protein product [Microthlaspi erraticum]